MEVVMEGLTGKVEDNYCSVRGDFFDLYNKIGQLEDAEEELGVEFLPLMKAEMVYSKYANGYVVVKRVVLYEIHTRPYLEVYVNIGERKTIKLLFLDEFGKTWAFAKEGLK